MSERTNEGRASAEVRGDRPRCFSCDRPITYRPATRWGQHEDRELKGYWSGYGLVAGVPAFCRLNCALDFAQALVSKGNRVMVDRVVLGGGDRSSEAAARVKVKASRRRDRRRAEEVS